MNPVENTVLNVAQTVAPDSPLVEVAQKVVETVANPSPAIIAEDLILVCDLAKEIKSRLAGKHPNLLTIFQALL